MSFWTAEANSDELPLWAGMRVGELSGGEGKLADSLADEKRKLEASLPQSKQIRHPKAHGAASTVRVATGSRPLTRV